MFFLFLVLVCFYLTQVVPAIFLSLYFYSEINYFLNKELCATIFHRHRLDSFFFLSTLNVDRIQERNRSVAVVSNRRSVAGQTLLKNARCGFIDVITHDTSFIAAYSSI